MDLSIIICPKLFARLPIEIRFIVLLSLILPEIKFIFIIIVIIIICGNFRIFKNVTVLHL